MTFELGLVVTWQTSSHTEDPQRRSEPRESEKECLGSGSTPERQKRRKGWGNPVLAWQNRPNRASWQFTGTLLLEWEFWEGKMHYLIKGSLTEPETCHFNYTD